MNSSILSTIHLLACLLHSPIKSPSLALCLSLYSFIHSFSALPIASSCTQYTYSIPHTSLFLLLLLLHSSFFLCFSSYILLHIHRENIERERKREYPQQKKETLLFFNFKKIKKMGGFRFQFQFHLGLHFFFLFCSILFILVSASSRNLPIIPFDEGYTPLFGDSNLVIHRDGKSVHLTLDERTGLFFFFFSLFC